MTTLNIAQTIFTVFYAIFWGAIFNVLGRWKAFNFGAIFDNEVPHITRRILLAKLILNILPILYFVWILFELNDNNLCPEQRKCWIDFTAIVLSGIIPAFAIFGFYRIWIGIIEHWPDLFYEYSCNLPSWLIPCCCAEHKPEPGLEELGILPSNYYACMKNIIVGVGYILLGGLASKLPYLTMSIILLLFILCFWCRNLTILHAPPTLRNIFIYFLLVLVLFFVLSIYINDYTSDPIYNLIKLLYNLKCLCP